MTDSNAANVPELTRHAIQRFQERIAPMDTAAILTWFQDAWLRQRARKQEQRTHIRRRPYNGQERCYLVARAPNGRVAHLALSVDGTAVLTVLDSWHWNLFVGEPVPQDQVQREIIIRKLIAPERLAQQLTRIPLRESGIPSEKPARRAEGTTP